MQRHAPADYVPLLYEGREIGLIQRANLGLIAEFPAVFEVAEHAVRLHVRSSHEAHTTALKTVVLELAKRQVISFRKEPYRIDTGWQTPELALVDRGAAYLLGIRCCGVHLNGIVWKGNEACLWIAHRAKDRVVCPGQLDQLVAGGLPAGLTAFETMLKEAGEEAAIPAALAKQARATGMISYCMDRPNGVSRDTIFAFDLELPPDFTPHNTDGEVERFELLPVGQVAEIVRTTDRFKWNCNLVIIDFLIRHGYLDSSHPEYTALCLGLRRSL